MKKINKVGEKHITNEGYTIEIIECFSYKNCTIQFDNEIIITNRCYEAIKNGEIKNPYHKSIFGVGFIGVGEYSWKSHRKIYTTWHGMLERCYSEKYHIKKPTYKGCSVCDNWCNFQNFAEWFNNNQKESQQLDKDILVKGNKIYSPDTCCFVPQEVNTLFIKCNSSRGKYPIGVSKKGNRFQAQVFTKTGKSYGGLYKTPEEAFQAYKTAKEEHIKEIADKWRDQIDSRVYEAMYNYQVEITD